VVAGPSALNPQRGVGSRAIWHRACYLPGAFLAFDHCLLAEQETMMAERQDAQPDQPYRVLLIDNDQDVTDIVTAILTDEGYDVSSLDQTDHDAIAAAVGQLEPDCILLDGAGGTGFGGSWAEAAYLSRRARSVPTVMFTAHVHAVAEAREGTTERARGAGFSGVVSKPFSLDQMLDTVATAVGRSERFDHSEAADGHRTRELVAELAAAGATDIRTSDRREWATFASPYDDHIYQLYWWQRLGVYIVGRYDDEARLAQVGRFFARQDAIAAAFGEEPAAAAAS
jgi:CheY-like chemotaxis protein